MTTITIERELLEQAVESFIGYRREMRLILGDEESEPCDAEKALRAALAAPATAPSLAEQERDTIAELNHAQWLALENVRLLAARHRHEKWAQHMLWFCYEAGIAARTLRAAPATAPEPCKWTFDDDESNTWASGCGELWSFIDGGPVENRVKYCHGCGKPVVLKDKP